MFKNKFLLVFIGLTSAMLMFYLGVLSRNALQEYHYIGRPGRDTIMVDGEGKVTAKPDVAMIELGVITEGRTVEQIQASNTQKMNAIIAAIKELGIASDDVQTKQYSLNPKYNWNEGKQTLDGYTISQNVAVKVRDMGKVGEVIGRAGELGANQVGGMQFVIDDPKALEAQARDLAIDEAREKAQVLAEKLGLTVVRAISFNESTVPVSGPRPYLAMEKADMAMAPAPTIEPGSQDVVSYVSVTFEVR